MLWRGSWLPQRSFSFSFQSPSRSFRDTVFFFCISHSFSHSFIHPFIHSSIHSLIHPFIHLLPQDNRRHIPQTNRADKPLDRKNQPTKQPSPSIHPFFSFFFSFFFFFCGKGTSFSPAQLSAQKPSSGQEQAFGASVEDAG